MFLFPLFRCDEQIIFFGMNPIWQCYGCCSCQLRLNCGKIGQSDHTFKLLRPTCGKIRQCNHIFILLHTMIQYHSVDYFLMPFTIDHVFIFPFSVEVSKTAKNENSSTNPNILWSNRTIFQNSRWKKNCTYHSIKSLSLLALLCCLISFSGFDQCTLSSNTLLIYPKYTNILNQRTIWYSDKYTVPKNKQSYFIHM